MEKKVHVYFGSNLREKNVKLATFDTIDEADEFVMAVVKAMKMKHSYIRKTKQSEDCYWYDYGSYSKFFTVIKEDVDTYK
ncbi:MAG: hypothetical protein J5689_00470 [Clostridia bacterium]|nr:hypothetical protein [Clostridia bacterium]